MEEYLQLTRADPIEPGSWGTKSGVLTIKDGVLQLIPTLPIPHSCVADFISAPSMTSGEVSNYGDIASVMNTKYGCSANTDLGAEYVYRLSECIGIIPNDTTKTLYNRDINIDKLRQLIIVDFGCGAVRPIGTPEGTAKFEPWLCRALHLLGVNVIGVDSEKSAEEWDFRHADITYVKAPEELKLQANSIDVVNANALFDDGYSGNSPSPSLFFGATSVKDPRFQEVEARIFGLALRILKPGGVFVISYRSVYQKVGGPLVFHFREVKGKGKKYLEDIMHVDPSFLNLNPQK